MSLADACVELMTEIYERYAVLTLDSDFTVYRAGSPWIPCRANCANQLT
jgi:hypothetical protein